MGKLLSSKTNLIVIIFVFLAFLSKSYFSVDPDFFWHIKIGELIKTKGIPISDPFSYTMPSFSYINHEWMTSIFLNIAYYKTGWLVLAILFSALALVSVLIPLKVNINKYSPLIIILAGGAILPISGIRAQEITWIFFSILITALLTNYYKKVRFFLPLFFLIWANLHGGFAIGLAVLFVFLLINFWNEKKIIFSDLFVFILCVLCTFINPYGYRLWIEILSSISDPSLKWILVEWRPLVFTFFPLTLIYICFSLFLVVKFRNKYNSFEKIIFFILLLAGAWSVRHVPMWAIFTIPLFSKGLYLFESESGKYKLGRERFEKSYLFLLGLTLIVFLVFLKSLARDFSLDHEKKYPKSAVIYLKNNPARGQIFSDYNWGGYLILNLPQEKVFIDGRMPSWRMKEKKGESIYALGEYLDVASGKVKFEKASEKYDIDTVLLPADKKEARGLNVLLGGKDGEFRRVKDQLDNSGWKIIYKDSIAVIYKKS